MPLHCLQSKSKTLLLHRAKEFLITTKAIMLSFVSGKKRAFMDNETAIQLYHSSVMCSSYLTDITGLYPLRQHQ